MSKSKTVNLPGTKPEFRLVPWKSESHCWNILSDSIWQETLCRENCPINLISLRVKTKFTMKFQAYILLHTKKTVRVVAIIQLLCALSGTEIGPWNFDTSLKIVLLIFEIDILHSLEIMHFSVSQKFRPVLFL